MNKWAFAAVAAIFASSVSAQDLGRVTTFGSLSYQYTFEIDDRMTDDGHGVHLSFGHFLTRGFALELAGDYSRYGDEAPFNREGRTWATKLGGLYAFNRDNPIQPYFGLGGGLANNQLRDPSDRARSAFGEATVGILAFLGDNIGLRGEWAYRFTDGVPDAANPGSEVSSIHEPIVRVGLLMPFGRAAAMSQEAPPASVVDSDGDGVPDDRDLCPGTPAGVAVDARGCPLDSDGDGVPDYLDKCPNTAAGVTVDKDGCPVDTAGPNRTFENVNFAFDRAELTDYARGILDSASQVINQLAGQHASLKVQIDGHTDAIGSPGYNVALSERRANAVKQYLVRKGVDASRIETQGFGLTKPIATNDTAEGRALNRRAEVRTHGQ